LKRRAAAWRKSCRRLANVDLRNLRYDCCWIWQSQHRAMYAMTLAESPEGATHGGCVILYYTNLVSIIII